MNTELVSKMIAQLESNPPQDFDMSSWSTCLAAVACRTSGYITDGSNCYDSQGVSVGYVWDVADGLLGVDQNDAMYFASHWADGDESLYQSPAPRQIAAAIEYLKVRLSEEPTVIKEQVTKQELLDYLAAEPEDFDPSSTRWGLAGITLKLAGYPFESRDEFPYPFHWQPNGKLVDYFEIEEIAIRLLGLESSDMLYCDSWNFGDGLPLRLYILPQSEINAAGIKAVEHYMK